jgi:hypothetical protein
VPAENRSTDFFYREFAPPKEERSEPDAPGAPATSRDKPPA